MNYGLGGVEKSLSGGLDVFKLTTYIYIHTSCVSPGLTAQEQKDKYAGWSVYVVHSVIADLGCICAASQEVSCEGTARTVELLYASQSNGSKTLYVWRLIWSLTYVARSPRLHPPISQPLA